MVRESLKQKMPNIRATPGLQTKLKKTYIYQAETTWTLTRENVLANRQ